MLKTREHLSAEPLDVSPEKLAAHQADKRTFIGGIALDSAKKCDTFIAVLTGDQASLNAGASITSTVLTALATVVTPIRTAHALSAGATVASGSRDAINANLYNKGTFSAFHTALQSTYYKNLHLYLDALSQQDENSLNIGVEATKLQTIHATCSLAAAEASILATIQPPPPARDASSGVQATGAGAPGEVQAAGQEGTTGVLTTRGAIAGARIW